MPKVVPSQVVEAIDQVFPNAKDQIDSQQGRFSVDRTYQNEVAAIVAFFDQIPSELIKLDPKDHTALQMAVTAIKNTLPLWNFRNYGLDRIKGHGNLNPVTIIRNALSKCPDEGVSKSKTNNDVLEGLPRDNYVDTQRILELKAIKSQSFDLARLIRLCEEINVAYQNRCYMTIAMVLRSIIDHVPPIFGASRFSEVANNYSGPKSFKDSMKLLHQSLRNVADSHLHVQIRRKETLPVFTQVNFRAELDLLLSEIIILLK